MSERGFGSMPRPKGLDAVAEMNALDREYDTIAAEIRKLTDELNDSDPSDPEEVSRINIAIDDLSAKMPFANDPQDNRQKDLVASYNELIKNNQAWERGEGA